MALVSRGPLAAFAVAIGLAFAAGGASSLRASADRRFPVPAEALLDPFAADAPAPTAYDGLFRYFLIGFLTYSEPHGAAAHYPGLPSHHGKRVDGMEGFSRFAPLAAAWLKSGRPRQVEVAGVGTVDLTALIRRGLLNGTDTKSPGYWGPISDRNQRIVEAADVALILWLTRDFIWQRLKESEKDQIQRWLSTGHAREVPDNNWHLFPTFVPLVLHSMGRQVDLAPAREHYNRLKTFYRGEGWFSDGPGKVYDYYNAWGIHYHLYWISRVDPTWDPDFIATSRHAFLKSYKYLIGRGGVPIRGRSICYRMAAPAPLVFDYASKQRTTRPGEARRALDLTWTHFIRRDALRMGTVTQGYCGPDHRLLDNYSGPASCLWSLRSLIPAFALPAADPFWAGKAESLPIDRGSYRLRVKSVGWTISGNATTGLTALTTDDSLPDSQTHLRSADALTDVKAWLTRRPHRPRNEMAKYHGGTYYSEPPFCGCPHSRSGGLGREAPGPQSSPRTSSSAR